MSNGIKDFQIFSDIYDCAINPQQWESVLDRSVSITGALGGILGSVPIDVESEWTIGVVSELWRQVSQEKMEFIKDNFYQYEIEAWEALQKLEPLAYVPDNLAYSDTTLLDRRADYKYLEENIGILRKVAVRLNEDRARFDTVIFQFDKQLRTIPEPCGIIVKQLAPHFAKSLELSRTFQALNQNYNAVLSAIDHVNVGLCILDHRLNIVLANKEAQRIFSETGYLFPQNGRLKCYQRRQTDQLESCISNACFKNEEGNTHSDPLLVMKREGQSPVFVHASHLRDSGAELGHKIEGVIVTLVDLAKASEYDVNRFSSLYGLTPAESAVCRLLLDGLTNRQIADSRDTSFETVKSQVKSIFAKAEVDGRVELVKLILKISPPIVV